MNKPTTSQAAWTLYAASAILFSSVTAITDCVTEGILLFGAFLIVASAILGIKSFSNG